MSDADPRGDEWNWRKGAQRFAAILLVAMSLIVVLAARDRAHVADLEHFEQLSAVGDITYLPRSRVREVPPPVVATLNGQPLYIIDPEKKELKDTHMLHVGRDQVSGLSVYTPRPPEGADLERRNGKTRYFLKTDRNEYVTVGPSPPENPVAP